MSCKSGKVDKNLTDNIQILLLLKDGVDPKKLDVLQSEQVTKLSKVSKTQNLWQITFKPGAEKVNQFITKLGEDSTVLEANLVSNESGTGAENISDIKKAKSKPN